MPGSDERPVNIDCGYDSGELPLAGYAVLVGIYGAAFAAFLVLAKEKHVDLPKRMAALDLLLLAAGTFKLSRVIAKDRVTAPIRAPFASYQGPGETNELREKPRGSGMRRAVADLITCPWCTGAWTAAALTYSFVLAPGVARVAATLLTAAAASDVMNLGHDILVKKAK